jgi:hypothetical protein
VPFQPFGIPFEIVSPLSVEAAKARIRDRKKGWFDQKVGARGWILGPVICLWRSAFDKQGPMLIGWIADDGVGTRITGRAGSDLNGLAAYLLYAAVLAGIGVPALLRGASGSGIFAIWVLVLLTPVMLWLGHVDRRKGTPLVRFLEEALTEGRAAPDRPAPLSLAGAVVRRALVLIVNGEALGGMATGERIHDAAMGLGDGDFLILEAGEQHYMQTATDDGATFVIEWRDGGTHRHFRARHAGHSTVQDRDEGAPFSIEEVEQVFAAYAAGQPSPPFIDWEAMEAPG